MNADLRRLLIVSPHWPPVAAPDHQRVRMSAPYYRENGWDPVVLAVDPGGVAAVQEAELAATVPPDLEVHRCRAWRRRLGLGNLGWRALRPLDRAGSRLLGERRFDLVFFSTTQFVTLALGPRWRRCFGVPYVVDIQDPWRTGAYEEPGAPRPPGGWKYRVARLAARLLEERCLRGAAGFVSVSPRYLADLGRRYPWFPGRPQAPIPFGVSLRDLEAARALPLPPDLPARRPGELRLVYAGAAGPALPHAAANLFAALQDFRRAEPAAAGRLRLCLLGTQYVAPGGGRPAFAPLAAAHGVADLVFELPHRLGYLQSLRCLLDADALLLLGSDDPAYSPSKLYPYYLAERPMLAIVRAGGHLEDQLRELACAWTVPFAPGPAAAPARAQIAGFLAQAAAGLPGPAPAPRNDGYFRSNYLAGPLAARQCRLFADALAAR